DFFNARKEKNDYYKKNISKKEDKKTSWLDIDWNISSIWEDKTPGTLHEFTCQFGDIRQLRVTGEDDAVVQLKNGVEIPLDGTGFNDMGTSVVIMDEEIGKVIVRWSKIDKITFSDGTNSNGDTHGNYIYGTVATYRKGTFSGFIQWDMDERLTSDMLDGDNQDGDVSIAFGKIKTIVKYRNGSKVQLNSGREFYLTNSNDVNNENRGILMIIDGIGEVQIPWRSFESVEFKKPEKSMFTYDAFKTPKGIEGTVYLHDNESHAGKIIYDIDEVWEMETLEGDDDDVKYRIPFRYIKSVQPKNYAYSMITLRNDDKLLLGDGRDVSDKNDGLLVLKSGSNEPDFIDWDKISEIVFK
ncbi:MAG: hypothetical protein AAFQ94_21870, partial [Bacteroidota bacterium]